MIDGKMSVSNIAVQGVENAGINIKSDDCKVKVSTESIASDDNERTDNEEVSGILISDDVKNEMNSVMEEEIIKDNIKINDNMAQKIRKESERYKKEDYTNFLLKDEMLELIKPIKKKEEDLIRVPFTRKEVDRYFGVVEDIEDLKRRIIYSLEETYMKY